jgi:O-methyltransferase involved in polyketide biosynthesis
MQEQTPSKTAIATAYIRAAHQLLDDQPLLLEDPVALRLLGEGAADTIQSRLTRHQSPAGKALRAHVVLRSRITEDMLEKNVEQGLKRFVLIRAGFGSYALRQPDWAKGKRLIKA